MKFNFFGKNVEIPPVDKKKVLTGAGIVAAGLAKGMNDAKLPETPTVDKEVDKTEYVADAKMPEKMATLDMAKTDELTMSPDELGLTDATSESLSKVPILNYPKDTLPDVVGRGTLLGKTGVPYYDQVTLSDLGVHGVDYSLTKTKADKLSKVNPSAYKEMFANTVDDNGNYCAYDGFRNGDAWLVRIPPSLLEQLVFVEDGDGNLYLYTVEGKQACYNLWIPVYMKDKKQPSFPTPETKTNKQENRLVAKRSEEHRWFRTNPVTKTREVVARFVEIEMFNIGSDGNYSQVGTKKLYLVLQNDRGHSYWKKVDGEGDFTQYYNAATIKQDPYPDRDHGLSATSYTMDVPSGIQGDALDIELAEGLLFIDVEN